MAVESIIEAYWQIKEYFTIARFSYPKKENQHDGHYDDSNDGYTSDIDVLAFNAKKQILVLAESKAHGDKSKLKTGVLNEETISKVKENGIYYAHKSNNSDRKTKDDLLKFFSDVKNLIENKFVLLPIPINQIKELNIHFVSTTYFEYQYESLKSKPQEQIKQKIIKDITDDLKSFVKLKTKKNIKINIIIQTHFDLILEIIELIKLSKREKRYGHPVLDIIRELNRHLGINKKNNENKIKKIIEVNRQKLSNLMQGDY